MEKLWFITGYLARSGLSDPLQQEISPFGIKVIEVTLIGFRTRKRFQKTFENNHDSNHSEEDKFD